MLALMHSTDLATMRFDGRALRSAPPLFAGGHQVAIIMTTAVWGSLSFADINRLLNRRPRYYLGSAARALEKLKICVVTGRRPTVHVRLDDRHPMADQIRRLGRKLYRAYVRPLHGSAPARAKTPKRTSSRAKYSPKSIDMHIMGRRPQVQILHLVAEVDEIPAFMIIRLLGFSTAMYKQIRIFQELGIFETKRLGVDLYVKMNRSWVAYKELRALLKALNRHLPTYKVLADVHRERRRQCCYVWSVRLRRTQADTRRRLLERAATKHK